MEAVKEWVRSLAMLIILATCLELLVPMGAMKKYVRVAMGLLLMLNMVEPLFRFLRQPVVLDSSLYLSGQQETRLPTLAEIMEEAEQFRERNEALALEQTRTRLEAEAQAAAREVDGVFSAQARVELDGQAGAYDLRRVVVTVTPGTSAGVRPVTPVHQVSPVGADVSAGPDQEALPPEGDELALAEQVRRAVARRLELDSEQPPVEVLIRRESAPRRREGP